MKYSIHLIDQNGAAEKVAVVDDLDEAQGWLEEWARDDLGLRIEARDENGNLFIPEPPPTTYEVWLGGCEEFDLAPALVYSTDSLDELRQWRNAVEKYEHQDYQLTVLVDGKPVDIPLEDDDALAMPSHDDAQEYWDECQRDEFSVYELVDSHGGIVDRDVILFRVVEHLLTLWINSDPMGGYFVRERQAVARGVA